MLSPSPAMLSRFGPGPQPMQAMYQRLLMRSPRPWRWVTIEQAFLDALWRFDQNLLSGTADPREGPRDKGEFFTDVLVCLLESASRKALLRRSAVAGLVSPTHEIDASYPARGNVEILIEARAIGAPLREHDLRRRKSAAGGRGASDLGKRVKEVAFKTIDIKAEWSRAACAAGPIGDLTTWVRRSSPLSFFFLAVRVGDADDLDRTITFANAASQVMDGVGLVAYLPDPSTSAYIAQEVPSYLELDRTLARVCTALGALP